MDNYTPFERVETVQLCIQNSFSIAASWPPNVRYEEKKTKRKVFLQNNTIKRLYYKKLTVSGNLTNGILASAAESPETSSPRWSAHLGIPRIRLRIIHDDLNLLTYKIQLKQKIEPQDKSRRIEYCTFSIEMTRFLASNHHERRGTFHVSIVATTPLNTHN